MTGHLSEAVRHAPVNDIVAAAEQRWDTVVDRCVNQLEGRGSPLVAAGLARGFLRDQAHRVLRDTVALVNDGANGVLRRPDVDTVEMAGQLARHGVQPAEAALAAGVLYESAMSVLLADLRVKEGPWEPVTRFCAVLHAAIYRRLVLSLGALHEAWLQRLRASRSELRLQLLSQLVQATDAQVAGSVRTVFEADENFPGDVETGGMRTTDTLPLTEREREVLKLAGRGLTNQRIATSLGIREGTVRTHLHRAFRKLGAHGRLEAVHIAASRALIPPQSIRVART